jgi:hypothetical protein
MIHNFPNWKFVCLSFSHLCELSLNRRSGGEGRELPPTTAWWQFPALHSAPAVEPRVLSRNKEIEIPNKTKCRNCSQIHECRNWEHAVQFNFWEYMLQIFGKVLPGSCHEHGVLVQHGILNSLAGGRLAGSCDLYCDGRSVPQLPFPDRTVSPGSSCSAASWWWMTSQARLPRPVCTLSHLG